MTNQSDPFERQMEHQNREHQQQMHGLYENPHEHYTTPTYDQLDYSDQHHVQQQPHYHYQQQYQHQQPCYQELVYAPPYSHQDYELVHQDHQQLEHGHNHHLEYHPHYHHSIREQQHVHIHEQQLQHQEGSPLCHHYHHDNLVSQHQQQVPQYQTLEVMHEGHQGGHELPNEVIHHLPSTQTTSLEAPDEGQREDVKPNLREVDGGGEGQGQGQLHELAAGADEQRPRQEREEQHNKPAAAEHGERQPTVVDTDEEQQDDEEARERLLSERMREMSKSYSNQRRRKERTMFTKGQISSLEREFQSARYLTRLRRYEISLQLGLTERQVKVWFQNRRMKSRRIKEAASASTRSQAPVNEQQANFMHQVIQRHHHQQAGF